MSELAAVLPLAYRPGVNVDLQNESVAPENLKPILHCKIEQMSGDQLLLLNRVLQQIEAEALAERLSRGFDEDQQQGKLSRISELVKQFRTDHPYR